MRRLGRYDALVAHWREAGLSTRAAHLLAWQGLVSVADVRRFGAQALGMLPKCGRGTVGEIGYFIGGWSDGAVS